MADTYSKLEWDEASGKWAPPTNRPGASTLVWDGFSWQHGEKNPEGPGALSRGLRTGYESTMGLVTEALPALIQSGLGFDEAAKRNLEQYQERMETLRKSGLGSRVGLKDVSDLSSALSFVGESIGEGVVNLLPVGGAALAGGKIAAKYATTQAVEKAVAAETAKRIAAGVPANLAAGEAAQVVAAQAAARGVGAGAGIGSWALNAPETFTQIYDETGTMRPGVAAAVGTAKAALDSLTPISLIKKVRGAEFADRVTSNVAAKLFEKYPGTGATLKGILETAAKEGLTEGAQSLLDEMTLSVLANRSINWNEVLESAVKGGVGAAPLGGASGFAAQRRQAAGEARRAEAATAEEEKQKAAAAAQEAEGQRAEALTTLGAPPPPQRTDEELKSSAIQTVRNLYPTINIDEKGKISAQDVNREAQRRTAEAKQRGEDAKFTQVRSALMGEISQELQTRIGQARAESRIPQETPVNIAATPTEDPLQKLRALAAESIEGLPRPQQEAIMEARRQLQQEGEAEANLRGLVEGFPPQEKPRALLPAPTYEIPGRGPGGEPLKVSAQQVYALVDREIARGREDLKPIRDAKLTNERTKIELLIEKLTQPQIEQVITPTQETISTAAEAPASQEDVRTDIQGYVDRVQEALPEIDPAAVGAAARAAYRIPQGQRLNQVTLTRALRQAGIKIPLPQIAQIEKALRTEPPPSRDTSLFDPQGVKVGGVAGSPIITPAPVEDLSKIGEVAASGGDLSNFTSRGLTQYLDSKGVEVAPRTKRARLEQLVRGESPSTATSLIEQAASNKPFGEPEIKIPPNAPKETMDNLAQVEERLARDEEGGKVVDTPYSCR